MDGLQTSSVKLPKFSKTFNTYRMIQARVDEQARKALDNKFVNIASKTASKTAEAVTGTALGAALGSVVPGIGTLAGGTIGGVVGSMGAEALTDWLSGFLAKPYLVIFD